MTATPRLGKGHRA